MDLDVSWGKLTTTRRARLASWLRAVGSSSSVSKAEIWLGRQPEYLALAERWDELARRERDAAWEQLSALFRAAAYSTRPHCIRCGTCCGNAGPTLYAGDEGLLRDRLLAPSQLRTHRAGEEVYSHWTARRVVLERECVMVASAPGGECALLDRAGNECRIYEHRPAQCKAQKCWDTADANQVMGWPSLTREQLLGDGHPVAATVVEHEQECSVTSLRQAVEAMTGGGEDSDVVSLIRRDREIRERLLRRRQASQDAMPFFLGRPLEVVLPSLGHQLVTGWDRGLSLRPFKG